MSTKAGELHSADLMVLRELAEARKVAPAIDRTYPLSKVAAGIGRMQDGHARGKLVITVP